jgi:cyclic beta-1,2-glucan synthetase
MTPKKRQHSDAEHLRRRDGFFVALGANSRAAVRRILWDLDSELRKGLPSISSCQDDSAHLLIINIQFLRYLISTSSPVLHELFRLRHSSAGEHAESGTVPNLLSVAHAYFRETNYRCDPEECFDYFSRAQGAQRWLYSELRLLIPVMILCVLLDIAAKLGDAISLSEQHLLPSHSRAIGVLQILLTNSDWPSVPIRLLGFEESLRSDPTGTYLKMDESSRCLYRQAISRISSKIRVTEDQVAAMALSLAREASEQSGVREYFGHVGYYLIDSGIEALYERLGARGCALSRMNQTMILSIYLSCVCATSLLLVFPVPLYLAKLSFSAGALLLVTFSAYPLCVTHADKLMEILICITLPRRIRPRLDFSLGIPPWGRTLVAVPAKLMDENQTKELIRNLEKHFLRSKDDNVLCALLTDIPDNRNLADSSVYSTFVQQCQVLVQQLNDKYSSLGRSPFYLFHRKPSYSKTQRSWIGSERKRGKIEALNELLVRGVNTFDLIVGELHVLNSVRYVLVIDDDGILTPGGIQKMAGTLAHPLNRAYVDSRSKKISRGYSLLQPRSLLDTSSTETWRFAPVILPGEAQTRERESSGPNPMQDLFDESVFCGKGLYNVASYHAVLHQRLPSESVLSHDVLEGAHARTWWACDIGLLERAPSNYSAFSRRRHRWIRGDWQNLIFLFHGASDRTSGDSRNGVSPLFKWILGKKIVSSAKELALVGCLCVISMINRPNALLIALIYLYLLCSIDYYFALLLDTLRGIMREQAGASFKLGWKNFRSIQERLALEWCLAGHQAILSADAILRTLVRLVTRRNLLEWETMTETELFPSRQSPSDMYLSVMPILAIVAITTVALRNPIGLYVSAPILFVWGLSSLLGQWLTSRRVPASDPLTLSRE